MSQVDLTKQGVYKLTGTFVVPEGYQLSENLALPKAYAYLSVQEGGIRRLILTVCL